MPLLVIVLVSALFISLIYMNGYTGFATQANSKAITDIDPELPKVDIKCVDEKANEKCGSPCWWKEGSTEPSTYDEAKGNIGIMEWFGKCINIEDYLSNSLCCGDCDCPLDYPKCINGVCSA